MSIFGDRMPPLLEGTEVVDCTGKTIVPGYIEPHVHPFQLYHPQSFADFCGQLGTTTFISDNLSFVLNLENKKAFSILESLKKLPFSFIGGLALIHKLNWSKRKRFSLIPLY